MFAAPLCLWYFVNPAPTPSLVLLPSVYILLSLPFCICFVRPSILSVFIFDMRSYKVTSHRSLGSLYITVCRSWGPVLQARVRLVYVPEAHFLNKSKFVPSSCLPRDPRVHAQLENKAGFF